MEVSHWIANCVYLISFYFLIGFTLIELQDHPQLVSKVIWRVCTRVLPSERIVHRLIDWFRIFILSH